MKIGDSFVAEDQGIFPAIAGPVERPALLVTWKDVKFLQVCLNAGKAAWRGEVSRFHDQLARKREGVSAVQPRAIRAGIPTDPEHVYAIGAHPLTYRVVKVVGGKEVVVEAGYAGVSDRKLKMRVRPPRKQAAARANVSYNARRTTPVIATMIEIVDGVVYPLDMEIVGWVSSDREHRISQDMRSTPFDIGAKYAGTRADMVKAKAAWDARFAAPKPYEPEKLKPVQKDESEALVARIKALLGVR